MEESPFACDMSAIPEAERDVHFRTIKQLFQSVETVEELSNGYRFRFVWRGRRAGFNC